MKYREAALLLVSAAVLAYQVVLVRAFSIGQWHHFAYMVISVALLGFGASGALLAALERQKQNLAARNGPSRAAGAGWFALSATLFALVLPVSFALTQQIPFDPFLIVWDRRQLLYLGCYYLVLFIPFFAAAAAIGLALITESEQCPRLYFYNLVGSGAGAALAVGLLAVAPVERALLAVAGLAQGAAVLALLDGALLAVGTRNRRLMAAGLAVMATLTLIYSVQSASRRPFTLENSLVLVVASTAPRLTAVPAISRSSGPITRPRVSNSIRIRAASSAAA